MYGKSVVVRSGKLQEAVITSFTVDSDIYVIHAMLYR